MSTHMKTARSVSFLRDELYKALVTGCALSGPSGCAAAAEGDGPLDIDAKVQALLKAAYDAEKANTSVPITSGQIRVQLNGELYSPSDWSHFMNLVKAEAPDPVSPLLRSENIVPHHTTTNRRLTKRLGTVNNSPSYTLPAIFCADSPDVHGTTMTDVFEAVIAGTRNVSHMCEFLLLSLKIENDKMTRVRVVGSAWPSPLYECSFWPVRSVERYRGPFDKTPANKILIASNIGHSDLETLQFDPITPLPRAQAVADRLGGNAVLVQMNGFGHTTLAEPSKCMQDIISEYMVHGTLPANGTVCEANTDFEVFQGVNTADILANFPAASHGYRMNLLVRDLVWIARPTYGHVKHDEEHALGNDVLQGLPRLHMILTAVLPQCTPGVEDLRRWTRTSKLVHAYLFAVATEVMCAHVVIEESFDGRKLLVAAVAIDMRGVPLVMLPELLRDAMDLQVGDEDIGTTTYLAAAFADVVLRVKVRVELFPVIEVDVAKLATSMFLTLDVVILERTRRGEGLKTIRLADTMGDVPVIAKAAFRVDILHAPPAVFVMRASFPVFF
ncbi:hypothetical protein L226DRAFT_526084 [Lentinus tigrinus ALCF2SS1-7]|uniref:uncharacterized protein n=1 Tax=Lentinus tigrinus ALCF2SS1-7 TaxID=1328758 RepID=UPI0011663224|nr:hypothetical protein L226DRAFT_526084 [Lentinus tigrinus ALCF2SS1-7]